MILPLLYSLLAHVASLLMVFYAGWKGGDYSTNTKERNLRGIDIFNAVSGFHSFFIGTRIQSEEEEDEEEAKELFKGLIFLEKYRMFEAS